MQLGLRKLVGVDINPEDIRKIARRMGPLYGAAPSAGKYEEAEATVPEGLQTLGFSFSYVLGMHHCNSRQLGGPGKQVLLGLPSCRLQLLRQAQACYCPAVWRHHLGSKFVLPVKKVNCSLAGHGKHSTCALSIMPYVLSMVAHVPSAQVQLPSEVPLEEKQRPRCMAANCLALNLCKLTAGKPCCASRRRGYRKCSSSSSSPWTAG